jgi:hypothetical protein
MDSLRRHGVKNSYKFFVSSGSGYTGGREAYPNDIAGLAGLQPAIH